MEESAQYFENFLQIDSLTFFFITPIFIYFLSIFILFGTSSSDVLLIGPYIIRWSIKIP